MKKNQNQAIITNKSGNKVTVKLNDKFVHSKAGVVTVKEIYRINRKRFLIFENLLGERFMTDAWDKEPMMVSFIFKVA